MSSTCCLVDLFNRVMPSCVRFVLNFGVARQSCGDGAVVGHACGTQLLCFRAQLGSQWGGCLINLASVAARFQVKHGLNYRI